MEIQKKLYSLDNFQQISNLQGAGICDNKKAKICTPQSVKIKDLTDIAVRLTTNKVFDVNGKVIFDGAPLSNLTSTEVMMLVFVAGILKTEQWIQVYSNYH